MSEIEKLERLKKLLDDGAISEEEYNSEKSKLLSKKVTNTNKNIYIFLVATFAFVSIYFLISERQEIQVIEAEIIDTTTTTEPLEELIIDESFVVDSIEDVISATVFINVEGVYTSFDENANVVDFEKENYGSGFLISSNGYIVTNQHVVSGASIVKVFFYEENNPRIARVIATSECSDLALLKIDIEDSLFFEWAEEQPFVGKEVYAAGFPLGNPEFTLLDGIVTKKEADGETPWASIESTFEHNAEIKQGNSGGPLIGKDDFKVYGVNYAGDVDQQEFAIKNSTAQKVINSMLDGSHMPGFGVNGRQYDGIGLFLNSVDIGSPLDVAGLEGGDLITKLGGISLEDKSTLKTYCDILSTQTSSGKVLIEYYSFKTGKEYSTILNKLIIPEYPSVQASDATTTTTTPATTTTTTTPATTTTTPATTNTQPTDVNSTDIIDTSLTFETTPPFVYFELIGNKVSDTEVPIIHYELAPYAAGNPDSNCNGDCFKFYFVQFAWDDANYSFQLYDNDLDGVTDELVRTSEQKEKPWVYDYWIEEELGSSGAVDWLILKEEYYFMANQDYLKPNLTSIGIRYCLNEYNRAYRGGWHDYKYRIWPDDCPYEHFFLVYRYGSVAELDGQSYLQDPGVVEYYGVRVFGP